VDCGEGAALDNGRKSPRMPCAPLSRKREIAASRAGMLTPVLEDRQDCGLRIEDFGLGHRGPSIRNSQSAILN